MCRKGFFKTLLKRTKLLILITVVISIFIGGGIYLNHKIREANSQYNSVIEKYKSEAKKIMFNQTNQSTLHTISSNFYDLSECFFLPGILKLKSKDYMEFTKYLAYRESLYQNLLSLTDTNASMIKPLPNQFKNLIDDINQNLSIMNDLYNNSLFIRDKLLISPNSIKAFVASFGASLSNSSQDELVQMLNLNFNKMLTFVDESNPSYNRGQFKALPYISPEDLAQKYMKDLQTYATYYDECLNKISIYLNNVKLTEQSDTSLVNDHFKIWNSLLNDIWTSLKKNLPSDKLSKLEYSQVIWINSKNLKTKVEQVQMTKDRLLELLNHYIYQTSI